ncbi:TRAP-type C4-dicarboxylate transport system, small permease component [Schinkia azotoformans MEV2011]|uniref:Tripartite ATP-independent periplasmic transporter DctQ component n=2 Tax=Schinkia azotoformans TaxID=1454 RepID=K6BTR7_SCHAZ|nr:TRAP transporter small permease [Schinkia azotoformans]EKN62340.1 tripartite ATP-independent periplasmic transporter DctQ component [Schinkia azotoformans LMG 9581]KEF38941.1 TRAP-type C4-dicarboxylate transport system, small permease component [Schinkia azotoformans MEV2011]MEC1638019.1 TRAP transporter small permease [Schinkia azotoformans]MEC1694496.1 TRAP transporter small permease [Schinkia azotoformans]MEC1714535.1 TRAP transporter small permease [Schinkia azotoformans]
MNEVTELTTGKESISLNIEKNAAGINMFEKFTIKVSKFFAWISGSAVIVMMLLIVINGIKRIFSTPILGTTEIVGWLAAISVSFALGFTQIHRGHVDIDLLVSKFPKGLQKVLRIIVAFLSLGFFGIVGWQLFQYAFSLSANRNVSQTLGVIYYPFVILSALGFFVFVLVLLKDLISEIKGGESNGSN